MQNIIVASDLSDRSNQAVRRGVELAIGLSAKLTVHHVVDSAMPSDIARDVQIQAKQKLQDTLALYLQGRDLTPIVSVEIGDVTEKINDAAKEARADLLIVGVHRRRVFLDQYRETTMERLIRSSRVPVLMVTSPGDQDYTHLLGAVGLSRACAAAIQKGRKIAPQAKISLFHAHEVSFRKESERDYATWKTVSVLPSALPDPMFIEASPDDAIHDLMVDGDYDIMAVGAHTRSSMGQFLLGGFTASLIRIPPCDLLIAK
jgi:nucleotide-binding universal stress UspA family protein